MSIHDIINEMSATAALAAKVPELETQVRNLTAERDNAQQHSQQLEQNIVAYKERIESLTTKLRQAEADRDEAAFRNLETDELLAKLRALLGVSDGKDRIAELEAQLKRVDEDRHADIERMMKLEADLNTVSAERDRLKFGASEASAQIHEASGQSEAHPPASITESPSANVEPTSAGVPEPANAGPAPIADPSPPMPYAGKRYWDHPAYVSLSEWLAGGGTEEDYRWRP